MKSEHSEKSHMMESHYRKIWLMALLSFTSMCILMYAIVNSLVNVFNNINEFYMAGMMTAPMIPHHEGAILLCKQASIHDPEIEHLCRAIIASQQQEIDQIRAKLHELQQSCIAERLKQPLSLE